MKGDYCKKDCLQIYALYLKMVEKKRRNMFKLQKKTVNVNIIYFKSITSERKLMTFSNLQDGKKSF